MFGWGRGKSFADCLEFAELFHNTMLDWVCIAFSRPHGVGSYCGNAVLRYHAKGFFAECKERKIFEFREIHLFLSAVLKYGFAVEI